MKLTSIFEEGDVIPSRYTCDGKDMSPPLSISDVPDDTQSLVLIVDDPDVPSGAWVHWVVVDISPGVREIAENTSPGVDLTNSFKRTKYGGPCPPSGVHRYFFKLYALDKKLTLSSTSTKTDVEVAMQGHIMAQAGLMGRYQRS
ncbi:MAG: YbhB/YbcL family Raf kinase inhibitor-like protein [Candidatus Altiarchaeota archaeon]|nr:YbhB/YbcL family Raf kinase inhibitor-like protein [Candidatus Altiarchaeota archaeon]